MAAVGSLKTRREREPTEHFILAEELRYSDDDSDSPYPESGHSPVELVYDTMRVGQEIQTRIYRFREDRQDWTFAHPRLFQFCK